MKLNLKTLSSTLMLASLVFSAGALAADTNPKDNNAIAWLIVVNQNEIDMGNEAKNRKINDDVIEFANFMVEEHTANLNKTQELGTSNNIEPIKDSKTERMEKDGTKKLGDMKKLDDAKFQKEYVKTMVKGHKDVLSSLDKYAKGISENLKEHFAETRTHIENHLEKAKELEKKQ